MPRLPFSYKGRRAAQVAAEIWYRARPHAAPRRAERHLHASAEFFATRERASELGLDEAERARIVGEAERAIDGTLHLLGLGNVDCGLPIDWHRDPVSGARFPTGLLVADRDWRIDWKFRDEINSMHHLYALGQAYALTGEERFRRAALEQVEHWQRTNPPIRDRFWMDGLECGMRLVAWLWLLNLLHSHTPPPPRARALLVDAVQRHARFIERDLPNEAHAHNHLIAPAGALALAGVALPTLPEAARWRRIGIEILARQAGQQVGADGSHCELALGYHVFVLEIYAHVFIVCRANNVALPPEIAATLERMYDFVLRLTRPDGMLPNLGDEGLVWHQLSRRPLLDARRLLSTGAVLFGRADMKWIAREFSADSAWLLGARGREQFDAMPSAAPAHKESHLADSGIVVWRSGWENDSSYFAFDAGPQGVGLAGHGHADALGFELFAAGAPLLIDPGTFTYCMSDGWRSYFRSTAAHNTVAVDGLDQSEANPTDSFRWTRTANAELKRCWAGAMLSFADATHDGYARLAEPVRHRRLVICVERRYWLLYDILTGDGSHVCTSTLHFADGVPAVVPETGVCSVRIGDAGVLVVPSIEAGLEISMRTGQTDPHQGWRSLTFGDKKAAPVLEHRRRGGLPLTFATLLVPYSTSAPTVQLSRLPARRKDEPLASTRTAGFRVAIDGVADHLVWSDGGQLTSAGEVVSDAEIALVRVRAGAAPVGACLPGGILRWSGAEVARATAEVAG